MGAIRKAFKIKNTIRHPIHAATKPVRRVVRKAVVPKGVWKTYYKAKTISTVVHNPISATVRSLDGIGSSKNHGNGKTYSDLNRERERLYRDIQRLSKTANKSSRYNYSDRRLLATYKTELNQINREIDSVYSSTGRKDPVSTNVGYGENSSADDSTEVLKSIVFSFCILVVACFVIMAFVQQGQQNAEKADTVQAAYTACKVEGLKLVEDSYGSPSIEGEDVAPETVSCLAEQMGIPDTFTTDKHGDIRDWGDYTMAVHNYDPYNVLTSETEYSVEITFDRS